MGLLSGLFIETSVTRQQNQLWLRLFYEKKTESEISFHWHVGKMCCSITVLCYSKYIRRIEILPAPQRRRVMCRSWAVSVQWTPCGETLLHLSHPQGALASVRHLCPGILSSVDCLLQCVYVSLTYKEFRLLWGESAWHKYCGSLSPWTLIMLFVEKVEIF